MKKSVKIGLVSVAAIIAVVSSLALFTHARESAADSKLNGAKENESALQAFSENFQHNTSTNATGTTNSGSLESQQSESTEAPGN